VAAEIERLDGLFVGQLSDDEMEAFEAAVKKGRAARSYEGVGGLMGLAKVRVHREASHGEA
jgi:hypothetical protein